MKKWEVNTQNIFFQVRWLLHGKVLTRLFELRDEMMLFLHCTDELYDRMHDFKWLAKLAYLPDVFRAAGKKRHCLQCAEQN